MSGVEVLRFAVRGVLTNRLRSVLTMLGIIIGVAAVILLTALGNGAAQFIQSQIAGLGANSITIIGQAAASSTGGASGRPLTTADAAALADPVGAHDVASVSPVVQASANAASGRLTSSATVLGSVPSYFPGSNTKIEAGRPYTQSDVDRAAKVTLLGRTVADELFGVGADAVGRDVLLGGQPYEVIGTLEFVGRTAGISDPDRNALVPLTTLQSTTTGFGDLNQIIVQTRDTADQAAAEAETTAILDRRHAVTDPADRDYQVFSSRQLASVLDQTLGALTLLLAGIAGISLVVGGIGITNIMLVSVSERTREIGIRKALGAPPSAILGQFLAEATILSIIGGVLGVGLGYAGTLVPLGDFKPTLLPSAVVLAVGVSVGIGIFFGSYPARRASRLRPIDALRRE